MIAAILAQLRGHAEFVRFAVVGCINVTLSFVVFVFFFRVFPAGTFLVEGTGSLGLAIQQVLQALQIPSVNAVTANVLGYLAGMVSSFTLNKLWTFRAGGDSLVQATRFVVLNLAGLALSSGFLLVTVDLLGGPYLVFWVVATLVVMILNYLGNRHWTFAGHVA